MDRREFFSALGVAVAAGMVPSIARSIAQHEEGPAALSADERFIAAQLQRGANEGMATLPIGDLVVKMGRTLLGIPYRENTLEQPGEEHLVVNLHELDCVTFCENSLALARTIKQHSNTPAAFEAQLRLIRYRGGVITGYGSRLHYFAEWIADNEAKGVVRNITRHLGGRRDTRSITFMSHHRDAYPRLADADALASIKAAEQRLNTARRYVLTKDMVRLRQGSLRNGDIVGITTSIAGLDCSHTGIVLEAQGAVKLLHASLTGNRVMISKGSLAAYLDAHADDTGIIVARPTAGT